MSLHSSRLRIGRSPRRKRDLRVQKGCKLKKTVDLLFEETGLAIEDVAERANMQVSRVEAIALGRWTPSPAERQKVAQVFGVSADEVAWGHTMDPRNIRYHRYGMKEDF